MNPVATFIQKIIETHSTGHAREHSYRPALKELFEHATGLTVINETQYFGAVPETTLNFSIGGYQPAQKWLKDRQDRVFLNEDIEHYQKMIVVLTETEKIMKQIDKII